MEYEFRQEIMNRLYDYAYKRRVQYDKDLMVVDIPEFSKLPEDTIESQIDVWITKLVIEGRLYQAYNDYIVQTI
jgi:hypothetical protein